LTSSFIVEGVAESAYGSDDPRQYRAGETLRDRVDIPLQAINAAAFHRISVIGARLVHSDWLSIAI
jgi:hypothetical protein